VQLRDKLEVAYPHLKEERLKKKVLMKYGTEQVSILKLKYHLKSIKGF